MVAGVKNRAQSSNTSNTALIAIIALISVLFLGPQLAPKTEDDAGPRPTSSQHVKPSPSSTKRDVKVMFRIEFVATNFFARGASGSVTYYINGTPTGPHTFDETDRDGAEQDTGVDYRATRSVQPGQKLTLMARFTNVHKLYTVAYIDCSIWQLDKNGQPQEPPIGRFYRRAPVNNAATHCTAQAVVPAT